MFRRAMVLSTCAMVWVAGMSASAQTSTDQVRLEVRLVSQMGMPSNPATPVTSADVATHTDTSSGLSVPRRFEVQYRIVDLNTGDQFVPAGLVSCGNLRIVASGGTLERAILSRFEARNPTSGTPALPPISQSVNLDADTSIISGAAGSPYTGLHAPFRAGITSPPPNNTSFANGVLSANDTIISGIVPLSLSQNDQNDGGWYGLYSFNFIPTAGSGTVSVSCDADPGTGNRFGFFNNGVGVPLNSPNATTDTATIVVGPCLALLPIVTQQPLSVSVFNGDTATFVVAAGGSPGAGALTYRWRRDGVNLNDGPTGTGSVISGAGTPTLVISNAAVADRGFAFDCVVTNGCGTVWSAPAGLNVTWRCQADFNRSGIISVQDIFDFLAAYFAGCP